MVAATDAAPESHAMADGRFTIGRATPQHAQAQRQGRTGQFGVTATGHQRRQAQATMRPMGRHQLRDHAAHGAADDVGALDVQCIEQTHRIGGHVVQPIRHARGEPQPATQGSPRQRRHAQMVQLAGQPHIAIVEADHVITGGRQTAAQRLGPQHHLAAQPHDQQHRRIAAITEALVFELNLIDVN